MTRIVDVEAAHVLAVHTDQARVILDCGHMATPQMTLVPNWREFAGTPGEGVTGWPGCAITGDGRRICAEDAAADDRTRMAAGEAVGAYVDVAGKHVTTWPGVILARITGHTSARTGFHGSTVHTWWATSPDGRRWWGRNGGLGMVLVLRPLKAPLQA